MWNRHSYRSLQTVYLYGKENTMKEIIAQSTDWFQNAGYRDKKPIEIPHEKNKLFYLMPKVTSWDEIRSPSAWICCWSTPSVSTATTPPQPSLIIISGKKEKKEKKERHRMKLSDGRKASTCALVTTKAHVPTGGCITPVFFFCFLPHTTYFVSRPNMKKCIRYGYWLLLFRFERIYLYVYKLWIIVTLFMYVCVRVCVGGGEDNLLQFKWNRPHPKGH